MEARTKAEKEGLEAHSRAESQRIAAQTQQEMTRLAAEADARAMGIRTAAEVEALERLAAAASAYTQHPALLRLRELDTLSQLAGNAEARIYIGFDKHTTGTPAE